MLGAHAHRAELVHLENLSVFSEALLLEYHGAFRIKLHGRGNSEKERRGHHSAYERKCYIQSSFNAFIQKYPSKDMRACERIYLALIIPIYMKIFNSLLCLK